MEEKLSLHISTNDAHLTDASIFYVHPQRLPILHVISDNVFESCLIDYTNIDLLSSIHFAYIMRTLKPEATVKVIVHQPITVMQEFDAKQVEANAKLAGFINFENSTDTFKDNKTGKEFNTIAVNFSKPTKNPNRIEIEVTKTTTTTTTVQKGKGAPLEKKATINTTTTTNVKAGGATTSTTNQVNSSRKGK